MVPKIIHYCWFGNEKNELVKKCIANWKRKLPDYEIKEWNENNIPRNIPYVEHALALKHYAFASDYIRVWAIYNYGGVYLDTDIEIIRHLDELPLEEDQGFLGFAQEEFVNNAVLGGVPHLEIYKEMCDLMDEMGKNVEFNTSPRVTTKILNKYGVGSNGLYKDVKGIRIFPKHVFYPYNPFDPTRPLDNLFFEDIKEDTFAVHHYMASWTGKSFMKRLQSRLKLMAYKLKK